MNKQKIISMWVILVLTLVYCQPGLAVVSGNDIPSSGSASSKLEDKVDKHVKDLIKKNKLPGMTVAITKEGRLIFTKGYGYANTKTQKTMKEDMRIRIGSVTKATITGPAGWQLMEKEEIIPKTQTLYGSKGIFKNTFESEIMTSIKRHTPIIDLAINKSENRVFAWYTNGTVSSGSSTDLDSHSAPKKFTLPDGKKLIDIRAIAFSIIGKVYVWYDDGTLSIGSPTDLDLYRKPGEKKEVSLPSGKSMLEIVGIGIAKSNDHVYIWYDDGTVSSGTSTDFDKHFKPKPFQTAPGSGGTSYDIRGMDIAANDRVYAWFSNGTVSSGTSTKLHQYQMPVAYKKIPFPASGTPDELQKWYSKITIQNLMDQAAGFPRSGDNEGAAKLFKTTVEKLTYEQIHRHFLKTRKLLYEPGTSTSYSNHGFGLWNLLIPKMSGMSYKSYVQNKYLKPMGLDDDIVPATAKLGANDASGHKFDGNGNPIPIDLDDSGLGLAAGGFTSSAQDLAKLMVKLDKKYSWDDLNAMGWGGGGSKRLEHNGLIDGGTAYAAMFPKGYKSSGSNLDLSNVHVVIITNIWTDTGDLETLANKIVVEVPVSDVGSNYDIWKGKPVKSTRASKPVD